MLSAIFGDFVIEEEDAKNHVQFCTREQYSAEIHHSGWFLDPASLKGRKDEEERELVNHRAAYAYHRGHYAEAVKEYKLLLNDFKHTRTYCVAVIDSLIRSALKDPSFSEDDLLEYLSKYEQSALDYGDQLQYLDAKKEVYSRIDGKQAQKEFTDAVCLLCATVDLPEHWLSFGCKKDLKVGSNFFLGYNVRALMLFERHMSQAHGFVVDVIQKKIRELKEKLEFSNYSLEQIQEARIKMGSDLLSSEEKSEIEDLERPAHNCRSKIGVYKTAEECQRILTSFKKKFDWMFDGSDF